MVRSVSAATTRFVVSRSALALLLVVGLLAALTTVTLAADPDSGTLTESSGDATWTHTFTAEQSQPAGDDCSDPAACDVFALAIDLPDGFWDTNDGGVDVSIAWTQPGDDLDMYIYDDANVKVGESAQGVTTAESARLAEPDNGAYEVRVSPFTATVTAYDGTASLTAEPAAAGSGGNVVPDGILDLPAADDGGLSFTATVPVDNQRDASEPIVDTDLDGNIIGCGPSGASQAAEYASMSTDGGDQFHLLGQPPRGQIGSGGGGDCSWAFAPEKSDPDGRYNLAYTGLGPLTNFTASRSSDGGETIETVPISGQTIPGVDRQWSVFLNETDVLLSYNQQQPRQVVVQKATDGGNNYGLRVPASPENPSFPGPMRALPAEFNPTGADNGRVAYFPYNQGGEIYLSVSFDEAASFTTCHVASSPGDPSLFVTADHDEEGTIYAAWAEDSTYHTYVTFLTLDRLADCNLGLDEFPDITTNPGWSTPLQVDRERVRTTVFPWLVASGQRGRVAISFYGTESDGNPNEAAFTATWDVYVNQSLNMRDDDATFSQVKATTHPFHYNSICQEGLGCSISMGDRSLADFFAIDHDPVRDALVVVYDQGNKRPEMAEGQVATPAFVRQISGPAMLGDGDIAIPDREPVRTSSTDPTGDAIAGYSSISGLTAIGRTNEPAGDFTGVAVGPEIDLETGEEVADGGFTVTWTVDDLSDAALQQAMQDMQAQSLLWIFRFADGYEASAAGITYAPGIGFGAGHNEYTAGSVECGSNGAKCIQYPLDQEVEFDVDVETGVMRVSVPREYLSALSPAPDAAGSYGNKQIPEEVDATDGTMFYDATMFSLGNVNSPTQDVQSFLYPLDNTPAFDFRLGSGDGLVGGGALDLVERLGGENRFATAARVSQELYPDDGSVQTVVVARGDDPNGFADALAGVPLAHAEGAPLLIVEPDRLPDETRDELERVLEDGGRVVLLGGPVAISASVESQIEGLGFDTERVAGEDRIETAIEIADELGNPETLFLTTGFNFPDALAAGAAAADVGGAILLTGQETRAAATDAYLDRFPDAELFAVGGPSARPYPEAEALFGEDREATAVVVAEEFFAGSSAVGLARSDRFPDALSGGPLLASLGGPILLTPSDELAGATEDHLCDNADTIDLVELFGGPVAINASVESAVAARITGAGC